MEGDSVNQSIFLIGFMGAGKTTIGHYLQEALTYSCIDLDHYIEQKLHMRIPDIFKQKGEDYFREIEADSLKELSNQNNIILSTGGGIIKLKRSREILKQQYTVYLKWPFDLLFEHIKGDQNRPLVQSYSQLQSLFSEREHLYQESAVAIIACENKSIQQVADEITAHFYEQRGDRLK